MFRCLFMAGVRGLVVAMFFWVSISCRADDSEFRAFWVDAFHSGFKTPAQVTQLIADVRAAHCNAIIVEVRKRGDAYYRSATEPLAAEITPGFDPLADIIARAHDTTKGSRLEVHAWVVAYPVWDNRTAAAPPKHPFALHPSWLTKDDTGQAWDGTAYAFDPGHPAVQKYLYDVCMEIVSRYDIDGFQFDHIRYDKNSFGYNDKTVARFNAQFGRAGQPNKLDADWLQFRRDQVTALVRKVYLNAIALKPMIKISAACSSRAPGSTTIAQWPKTAAYASTLQDWRAWLEEGMIDLVMPMTYFREEKWASAWNAWTTFEKDYAYERKVVIGPGIYMNTLHNTILQLHSTRVRSPKGNLAFGVALYSYAELCSEKISREKFFKTLTEPSRLDHHPMFPQSVFVPPLVWKTQPTKGHLMGYAHGANGLALDGAKVTVSGPVNRTLTTDATGFYGAVDLLPGNYEVSLVSGGGEMKVPVEAVIKAGVVEAKNLVLEK